jgi:hypothetical protein
MSVADLQDTIRAFVQHQSAAPKPLACTKPAETFQAKLRALPPLSSVSVGASVAHLCPLLANAVSIDAPARGATNPASQRQTAQGVSIHAPARGATTDRPHQSDGADVSIHAPARGATLRFAAEFSLPAVSIHAPARGATGGCCGRMVCAGCFNPRSRTGSDSASWSRDSGGRLFQSTLPHGERLPYGDSLESPTKKVLPARNGCVWGFARWGKSAAVQKRFTLSMRYARREPASVWRHAWGSRLGWWRR